MRVLVCGGRDYTDYRRVQDVLKNWNITCIIQGEARGADTLARQYAERHRVDVLSFPALWDKHGKAAGPIRNAQMLAEGKPDFVVAFPGGRGTQNMINQAMKAGIEVKVVEI